MPYGTRSSIKIDFALLVELVHVVAEADGALAVGPGGNVGGVDRHAGLAFHIEALERVEGLVDLVLIPIAIVAEFTVVELF